MTCRFLKMASYSTNWEEALEQLRKMREDQIRDGVTVVEMWEEVLQDYKHKLGDELWNVYEQVCVAALDCNRLDLAKYCIKSLELKFPSSLRALRLHGLLLEAARDYESAMKIYDKILEDDKVNMFAEKRKVAILKAQDKLPDAIKLLNEYLKKYMTDYDAWLELADLYTHLHDYDKATFCLEEVLMSSPHNHLYHQRYADLCYTQGGLDNLQLARSYYAHALQLNADNMRALYGLFLTTSTLTTAYPKHSDKSMNAKYASWAVRQIKLKYEASQNEDQLSQTKVLASLTKMLDGINVTHIR